MTATATTPSTYQSRRPSTKRQATVHRFQLPIRSETDLKRFVRLAWGIKIPDVVVCPNHTTPWRAFADAYFARAPLSVWKSSRGFGGKSYLLACLGLTEAATLKADVAILGGSGEQSENVHSYTQIFWDGENAPKQLLTSDPFKRETRLRWGNKIRALTASQKSVRGPHPQRLRLDEIDEMALDIFDSALGQPMTRSGIASQTVASSTHQYADRTMTEVLSRAAEKDWPVYEWCYKENMEPTGWLTDREVAEKRSVVTAVMWETEYELQEPNPESRAILPEAVLAMFRRDLGEYSGRQGQYIEYEPPIPGITYATGADWARKRDWTVIVTLKVNEYPAKLVAFERMQRKPWPAMVDRFDKRLKRYPGVAAHDATGLGDVVSGFLRSVADPVILVGRARADTLTSYIGAIERQEIISPFIRYMETEHRLASVDDVYGSKGHLPDTVAAGALAWHAGKSARRKRPPGTHRYA